MLFILDTPVEYIIEYRATLYFVFTIIMTKLV